MDRLGSADEARHHTELDHSNSDDREMIDLVDYDVNATEMSEDDHTDDSEDHSDYDSDSDQDDEEDSDQEGSDYEDAHNSDENTGNDELDEEALKFLPFDYTTANPQAECPLFQTLPGEIRNHIFRYTLTEYEDKDLVYEDKTPYKRPEFAAPRKIDTALLSTCKRVYQEGWYLPWSTAEHVFFLAWRGRRPDRVTSIPKMKKACQIVQAVQGTNETASVSVYAQLCNLEYGRELSNILGIPYLNPSSVCVTIRHTDWWNWETDTPLAIGSTWVNSCRLPDSTLAMRMQLESTMRRKDQIDDIAGQMIEKWTFRREDGTLLRATQEDVSVQTWTGKSTWEGARWVRDESRPGEIDYYVKTVVWKPVPPEQASEAMTVNNPGLRVSFRPAVAARDAQLSAGTIDRLIGEDADRMTGPEVRDLLRVRLEEEHANHMREVLQTRAAEQAREYENDGQLIM